ncbi:uncharacterized protein LOC119983784 isoform X2 [Tripterygium wilfordii]|nr:uncharacterized protein LOC119983784 isoform X2 [Tripterygium wilfordii]
MLQDVDGMNLTLDETLGDSNPHYSRVLREKIAARDAAHKAMEARKAALVEASWCRILRTARIQSKEAEAEALLLKAEKTAAEAFEAATALGVIMYDIPNCPRNPCQIETSSIHGGRSTTHTVAASFETAFDVDKKVSTAVKAAFIRLAHCPSFQKDEFKDLLWKISQNPDANYHSNQEISEFSSECETESGSECETISQNDDLSSHDVDFKVPALNERRRKYKKRRQSLEKLTMTKLVDMMLLRIKCLQEDELSSLATIVATCGLNTVLAEEENCKHHDANHSSAPALNFPRRMSSSGAGLTKNLNLERSVDGQQVRRKQVEPELPSLDKFLVKHTTKLEREVQEAKNSRKNQFREGTTDNKGQTDDGKASLVNNRTASEAIPDLASILMKHSSKFEREIKEAKKNSEKDFEMNHYKKPARETTSFEALSDSGCVLIKRPSKLEKEVEERRNDGQSVEQKWGRAQNRLVNRRKEDIPEIPSLDKFLVKHVSKLEKEVQEARNHGKIDSEREVSANELLEVDSSTLVSATQKNVNSFSDIELAGKENIDLNKEEGRNDISKTENEECTMNLQLPGEKVDQNQEAMLSTQAGKNDAGDGLENILVKPVHRLKALSMESDHGNHRHRKKNVRGNTATDCEGLDKILVKHVSRLQKEKMRFNSMEEEIKVKRNGNVVHSQMNEEGSLDQILVKHKPKLEREKMAAAQQPRDQIRQSVSRREARERELQEAWGGLSLGNSIRPHLSKLEKDKAAWIKAEEEERRLMKEVV